MQVGGPNDIQAAHPVETVFLFNHDVMLCKQFFDSLLMTKSWWQILTIDFALDGK